MDNGRRSVLENHLNIFGAPRGGVPITLTTHKGAFCVKKMTCAVLLQIRYIFYYPPAMLSLL